MSFLLLWHTTAGWPAGCCQAHPFSGSHGLGLATAVLLVAISRHLASLDSQILSSDKDSDGTLSVLPKV